MTFIKKIINDNQKIHLYKFDGEDFVSLPDNYQNDNAIKICFLDLETTGLDKKQCKIIEFAGKLTAIDKSTGKLLGIIDKYQSFNDPEESIKSEITRVTGITNEDVAGHSLDWEYVANLITNSDIIVAHNASFDRAFMDRYLSISKDKVWVCSVNDIDWSQRGFGAKGQEILCIWHGFYYESHRAMSDVDALIHLVTHDIEGSSRASMELLKNASKPSYTIAALNSPFETKDLLKARMYRWNPVKRYWWKKISFEEVETEKEWMADAIYNGIFQGRVEEISITDKYKS